MMADAKVIAGRWKSYRAFIVNPLGAISLS
jgi:hypothetical protein